MNNLKIWFNNLFNDEKVIKCKECNSIQPLAFDWDFQICSNCDKYLYDNR